MKITTTKGETKEIPVYGCVLGIRVEKLELTLRDLADLQSASDWEVRQWIDGLAVRFAPSVTPCA